MKFKHLIYSKKFTQLVGFSFLACLIGYGAIAHKGSGPVPVPDVNPVTTIGWQTGHLVKAKASLSQNKVLQGSDGVVYMQIDMEALGDGRALDKERVPTDFIVVLDRSGSMSGKNKMDYAQKAIESLLYQMGEQDRFALVTFDDQVETPIGLRPINKDTREDAIRLIHQVTPRGATNIEAGLKQGMALFKESGRKKGRAQRLILLSDGMANQGMTDVSGLGKIAAGAVEGEFVISTIGVGLDFNETLLASLADYGTGSYYFMENLAELDRILSREFYGASRILAKNIVLKLDLAAGIRVADASGYPLTRQGNSVIIRPGHLYYDERKTFFVTLNLPTKSVFVEALGDVVLSYDIDGKAYAVALVSPDFTVACLPPERKKEVEDSIDKETFANAWAQNNYGKALKESSGYVRGGDTTKAKEILSRFRKKLKEAYNMIPSAKIAKQIKELDVMEDKIDDAASGEGSLEKQKRLSKDLHYKGGREQRVNR